MANAEANLPNYAPRRRTLAKELFGSGQAIGQTVRIKGQSFRMIGVLNAKGSGGFSSVDDQALIIAEPASVGAHPGTTSHHSSSRHARTCHALYP